MPRTLVFVHGHHFKPAAEALLTVWSETLRAGLERDCPELLDRFDAAHKEMVYYGDLNNALLAQGKDNYDEQLDLADRRNALARLRELNKPKKFKRYTYEQLPGKSALPEILADVAAPVLGKIGLAPMLLRRLIPELAAYWERDGSFREQTLARTRAALDAALGRGDQLMVVAHGLGAIVAYDALWQLSREGQGAGVEARKVDQLITLGAPLGDETVKSHLCGHGEPVPRRYPDNILNWHNVAAEDDFHCHDKTVLDDFLPMLKHHLISAINDFRIYNMAVRYGRSNPHSAVGYLVHPRISKLLADWL